MGEEPRLGAAAERAVTEWRTAAIRLRDGSGDLDGAGRLPAPTGLRACGGRHQVTLDWEPVDGAVGYLLYRGHVPAGTMRPLDHGGGDVLAVPHPPHVDTTGEPGRVYSYAVAALADVGAGGLLSDPVDAGTTRGSARVSIAVDAGRPVGPVHRPWRTLIGSEHLSHLLCTDTSGGRPIGAELGEALRMAHTELGVQTVRAHAILGDDLGVYREVDGEPVYDFTGVDRVYDRVLELGLRPIVELAFMPRDLARDPSKTVFTYQAVISPPRDWDRWAELVRALVAHLVERYGLAEVRDRWAFEVWNEANLEVFWAGTREEYLRLYDVTARAVKAVDPDLRVGGPASAAGGWIGDLLRHVGESGAPIDFVSTHTYGSPPLDFRPLCARFGRPDLDILWTEWGVTPTHFNPISDEVFAGAFVLRGMRTAAGRVAGLGYWVVSDHFEELGRPPALFHGGFGLLTVGNLRKPRYWALALAERLGTDELSVRFDGDGAGSLVEAWATRHPDGTVGVLIWNCTLDQSKASGAAVLDRYVELAVTGLPGDRWLVRHWRVDAAHSNIRAVWERLGDGDWPDEHQWAQLQSRDRLDEYEPERLVEGPTVRLGFPLPMPGISYVEIGAPS
jgi:xylan 1,4-beta-xylosidase